MKFYQELQLNQKGSKELIKNSQTTKEKLYHIAVYLFKIAITVAFFFVFSYIICFQIPDHTVDDCNRFFRRIIDIRVHLCQEILKNLKDKRFSDRKAHVLTRICLIGKRTGISAKTHAEIFRQMIQRFL